MREIMYRGIPKEKSDGYTFSKIWSDNCDGSFVYGSLLISKGKYYICASSIFKINCCINNAMMSVIEVIPETIGQYTGLEANGKKIFEGDILQVITGDGWSCPKGTKVYYEVVFTYFNPDSASWSEYIGYMAKSERGALKSLEYTIRSYGAVVIGNIHDNPELLKGGAE